MKTALRRTNADWLADLGSPGPAREDALTDLRAILLAGLPYALTNWLSPDDAQFSALAEEVVQETLLRVLANLDQFEGRSQFTTWAHKIAVRVALTELRRRHWRDVSLENLMETRDDEAEPALMADRAPGPEAAAEQADMLARLQRIMMEELTEKQRQALIAARVKGMPLEEVARRMGMERNALYKLLHDARLRLKRRLAREGLTPEEVLAAFEQG
ncbi:MAG: sigma-70 family RNA polymerase sigma factor [Chloroflexi bacterium]|nr:sigma-70 family RNA polymerase sigma factor [Chloroflexota bacterium]